MAPKSSLFPSLHKQAQQFYGIAGFPKVVGVIDGTHIKILAPSEEEDIFVNRKGYRSINVQVVFDAFDRNEEFVARWPGSTHDNRILHNSGLRQLFERGFVNGGYHLLADIGYPCRRWLLTPTSTLNLGHRVLTTAHKITRSKVERGIGQLKRRFEVLHGEIRMKPEKACR
ncbi:putative nuclease HARBI1 [Mercenaria mercenaria]|uniref:putative nuclease HARBI1 n=1 Tax=Mercenaria mercenaria TaxID=6596 RepID=UPI00234F8E9C|nr:putative nuclease HARBI1 [Mercenaria mercenaria]